MPVSFQTRKMGRIQEERQFTNPAVRFVRIKGRVVPIINKKRVGQMTSSGASSAMKAGSILAGAGAAIQASKFAAKKVGKTKRVKAAKKFFASTPLADLIKKDFKRSTRHNHLLNLLGNKSTKRKVAGIIAKATVKPITFVARNPGKLGLAIASLGVIGKFAGSELQARSSLGLDILPENDGNGGK